MDMEETANHQFRPLREISSSAVSRSGQSLPPTCPDDIATRRAGILLGCYRKGDAEDPETFVAAVASVLASYPQEVAYRVTDPRSGLPGRSKWLPTPAEVREACEAEMSPARAEAARSDRRAHTDRIVAQSSSRISKDMWARLEAEFPNHAAPRKFRAPEQLAAEYTANPIRLSAAALETLKPKVEE